MARADADTMSANIDAEIGTKIHTAMWRAKKSQTQVARAIGLDQPAISKRLRGITSWKASELLRIADFLGVPLDDIQLSMDEYRALATEETAAASNRVVGQAGPLTSHDSQSDNACIRTPNPALTGSVIHVTKPQVTSSENNGRAA